MKLQTHDLSFFKTFFGDDGFQNVFFYQQTLDKLELEKDKGPEYVLKWKSKGVHNSELKPIYTVFVRSIKLSENRMGIKFDKDPLAV